MEHDHERAAEPTVRRRPAPIPRVADPRRDRESPVPDIAHAVLQAKLTVGPAGDRFEREADGVADGVVRSLQAESRGARSAATPSERTASRLRRRPDDVSVGGGTAGPGPRLQPSALADTAGVADVRQFAITPVTPITPLAPIAPIARVVQRATGKKGGGTKGGSKKNTGKKGGGKKTTGKKNGGTKAAARTARSGPVQELTAEEIAARAERERVRAEAEAARRAEQERLAAEAEAERLAQEAAATEARCSRGRRLWNNLTAALWKETPDEVKSKKGADGKRAFTRNATTAMMSAAFADLKGTLERGDFDDEATDEEITGDLDQLRAEWDAHLWMQVGTEYGTNVPTKEQMFSHLGWPGIKGKIWDLKSAGSAASGTRMHVTVSGDSMVAPTTLVADDPDALEKPPAEIFDALFMITAHNNRVHCTLESHPKKHLYLGGRNGGTATSGPMSIPESGWNGDARAMHATLADFRTVAIRKIVDAKLKGWRL